VTHVSAAAIGRTDTNFWYYLRTVTTDATAVPIEDTNWLEFMCGDRSCGQLENPRGESLIFFKHDAVVYMLPSWALLDLTKCFQYSGILKLPAQARKFNAVLHCSMLHCGLICTKQTLALLLLLSSLFVA
jgi:hypothetical protein